MVACGFAGSLAVLYFAVGPKSLRKACRSARSATVKGSGGLRTKVSAMLVTDDATRQRLALEWGEASPFAHVETIESAAFASSTLEFEATRPLGARGGEETSTSERWKNRTDPANVALRRLRRLKIVSVSRALARYDRAILMDADTYVCRPLGDAVCGVSDGAADVAFVPVRAGKEHAASVLARSAKWRVPGSVREANTGVVAFRNSTRARALVADWLAAYDDIADDSGFLMDQPAFRAALHATGAKANHLDPLLNCRGHDRALGQRGGKTAVPLRCAGFDAADLEGDVAVELKGGAGCVVLHSHDIKEPVEYPLYAATLTGPGWENVGSEPAKRKKLMDETRMKPGTVPESWKRHPREAEIRAQRPDLPDWMFEERKMPNYADVDPDKVELRR